MQELLDKLFSVVLSKTIGNNTGNNSSETFGNTTGTTNLTVEIIYNTTELPDIEYPGYTFLDYQSLNVTGIFQF